jgi:CheY-like chemotaxis protein
MLIFSHRGVFKMSLKGKNVLVIDDNEDMRLLVRDILETAGLHVNEAGNVQDAWTSLCANLPHLVISDIHMPPESGFDLIEKMKVLGLKEEIPVIVLSGLNDMKTIHTALALGVNDFVIKPFSAKTLLNKIRKSLHDEHLFHFNFPETQYPRVDVTIDAEIAEIGETGGRIKGLFKLKKGEDLTIHSPLLNGIKVPITVSPMPKRYINAGEFLNDVTFVGVKETDADAIRKKVASWRQS